MRSTNHRKCPTRSYRNDFDFASFGDSSASVLLTRNAARFDGEFSATGQVAPAENILSGRAIASARGGYLHSQSGSGTESFTVSSGNIEDTLQEPVNFHRATLFDSVMDFLDRYDQMISKQQSCKDAEPS